MDYVIFTANMQMILFNLFSTIGGEGNNVANDLEKEHFVQFDKKLLKGMGP